MWRKVTAYLSTAQTGYSAASPDRQGINYAITFEHAFANGTFRQHLTLSPTGISSPSKLLNAVKIVEQDSI